MRSSKTRGVPTFLVFAITFWLCITVSYFVREDSETHQEHGKHGKSRILEWTLPLNHGFGEDGRNLNTYML